jgi:RNA polymerase sigma-70 factor (ECF subfamily)
VSLDSLDALLEKLNSGDDVAAGQVFRSYEPYLRMVVRRHLSPDLRAKFDSLDVVQSVWIHVLKGFREAGWRFTDTTHLRSFLVQLTRHRFIDRLRHHRRALAQEEPLAEGALDEVLLADDPEPGAILEAAELWEQLLRLCPPAHHELLHLKRDGVLIAEIAARTGLNPGSVRRILSTLSRRLARQREEENSDSGRGL